MRSKLFGIGLLILIFCSGSTYRAMLKPHYTLSKTKIEIGMEETFDPYAYVLRNMQPIQEQDKENIIIEGVMPEPIPGTYEITYNQYMKLTIEVKDTLAPIITGDPFTWGQGLPFVWNEETLKKVQVSDNYTSVEKLREAITCEEIDTAYLGDRTATCSVQDEAGNVGVFDFHVTIEKDGASHLPKDYEYLKELPYDMKQLDEINQVLAYVNQTRASASLEPVSLGTIDLMNITYERAKEVQQLYSHDRPNGELCFTILDDYGYSYYSAGENVAKGQQSALEVMQDWLASQTHKSIIETPEFTQVGISVLGEGEDKVWTLIFVH